MMATFTRGLYRVCTFEGGVNPAGRRSEVHGGSFVQTLEVFAYSNQCRKKDDLVCAPHGSNRDLRHDQVNKLLNT